MKKASKKTARKKGARIGRPVGAVKKVQMLVTIEVSEGPLGKRAVADAVKTAFQSYSRSLGAAEPLRSDNLRRVAVNVNI